MKELLQNALIVVVSSKIKMFISFFVHNSIYMPSLQIVLLE
jgi:hypothetical protein